MSRFSGYSQFTGVMVPDTRVVTANLAPNDGGASNSSYTEAGRRPGVPTYDRAEVAITSATAGDRGPHMALESVGKQAAVSYHVKATKGGMPGSDAEVVFRPALVDGQADWRGFNSHNVFEWDNVDNTFASQADPATGAINYAAVRTADDQVLFVGYGNGILRGRRYNPATHTPGSYVTIGDPGATVNADTAQYDYDPNVPLCDAILLPTGRLLVYALTREIHTTASGNMTLWVFYSDDHGASWRSGNYLALDTLVDASADEPIKMRAAYSNESVLLLISKAYGEGQGSYGYTQFASDDLGINFKLVEDVEDASFPMRHPDIVVDGATGMLTVVYYEPTAAEVQYKRIANPFVPLSTVVDATLTTDDPTHLVAYDDTDGTLYVTWGPISSTIKMAYSRDGGATWTATTTHPFDSGDTDTYPDWEVASAHGRAIWIISDFASSLMADGEFIYVETGGWNTLCQPRVAGTDPTETRGFGGADGETWLPFLAPDQYTWALTGGRSMSSGGGYGLGVNFNTAAATAYETRTPGDLAIGDGLELMWSYRHISGATALTSLQVGVEVVFGSAAAGNDMQVEVRFSGSNVRITDTLAGGATVATAAIDTLNGRKVFKLALRGYGAANTGRLTLYSRSPDSDVWTALVTTSTLTERYGGGATTSIKFGHPTACTAETRWHHFHWTRYTGRGGAASYYDDLARNTLVDDPMVLYGKRLPSMPYRAWLDQQLYVYGSSGPAVRGDTWKVVPAYDYPISNIDVVAAPSPTRKWRSTGTGALQRIAWIPSAGLQTGFGSTSYGVGIVGANFPTCNFRGWDGAAWQTLCTIGFGTGLSGLRWTRTGDTITVDTGGASSATRWIAYDELAGATFNFGGGAGQRKIRSNTEGSWTNATTKRPQLVLEGITGAEPASGTGGEIWNTDATGIVHEGTTFYSRYCVEIPSNSTADGYFTLGCVAVCGLAVFGHKYSRNRSITTEGTYEMFTAASGARVARKLGIPFGTVEASWVEGFDASGIWATTPSPDYLSMRSGSTNAVAARGDSTLLEGIVRRTNGPVLPIFYLPAIPETTPGSDFSVLTGSERVVFGRLVDSVTRETVLGEEVRSEAVRLTGLKVERER